MKQIRIREDGTSPYVFISKTTGAKYEIMADKEKLTYKIRNITSGRLYLGKPGIKQWNTLLRNIRRHLEHFGVRFE